MEKEKDMATESFDKMPRALCIVLTIVFVGILLSFSIDFVISAYFDIEKNSTDYYDGKEWGDMFLSGFADSFYKDSDIRELVVNADYLFYGNLRTDSVLLGKDGFMFDIYDPQSGYNYIEDYVGGLCAGEEHVAEIAEGIARARALFAQDGRDCTVVVIPNAQTVYGELMPDYFGDISENTVLNRLTAYMKQTGAEGYRDMTDVLLNAKGDGQLYNNTENSLNSLGAYYVYRALVDDIWAEDGELRVIDRADITLKHHNTEGKLLAQRAGIETIHLNRTISAEFGFTQNYKIFPRVNGVEKTVNSDFDSGPVILLECVNEWDKIMLGDYFSNSFRTVGYRVGATSTEKLFETITPDITYIFVHEYQLSMFLGEG